MHTDQQDQHSQSGYATGSHLEPTLHRKTTPKLIHKHKRFRIAKPILSRKSNSRGITITYLKLYKRVGDKHSVIMDVQTNKTPLRTHEEPHTSVVT